jgi:dTDP-4-dehydrorhamnose reductase
MKVLVTGRDGQLARSLAERAINYPLFELHFASRPGCDLAVTGSAATAIREARPDLVISAAACTAVDKAEQEPDLARRINADAAGEIAEAAASIGAPLIHVSTDYVFGGTGSTPMREEEPIAPLGIYGRTKAAGEEAVRAGQGDHVILRTAWVYSPFGTNFVKTMLRLARERDEIAVVADQIGSPTNALDLADVILELAARRLSGNRAGWGETYHAAGSGQASWADFAAEIMRLSGSATRIRPIATAEFPTPARRPSWSVLDGSKLQQSFGFSLPQWQTSLASVVKRLLNER